MSADRPRPDADITEPLPPEAAATAPGELIVTDEPSSHQPHDVPPAGSEPQGRTTAIAAVVAVVVIVLLLVLILM